MARNIVIEGPDGVGKSTLIKHLQQVLPEDQYIFARHPGSTEFGQEIRKITHNSQTVRNKYTEQVLMAADLSEFVDQVLYPSLNNDINVISDRSNLISGTIYGMAGELSQRQLETIQNINLVNLFPSMCLIILYCDFDIIHDRQEKRGLEDNFESRGSSYHKKVHEYYGMLANRCCKTADGRWLFNRMSEFVHDFHMIDASKNPEEVAAEVVDTILSLS